LGIVLVFLSCCVRAEEPTFLRLSLNSLDQQFSLDQSIYVYEDFSEELGINDVISLSAEDWRLIHQAVPSFGFESHPFWFSIQIENQLDQSNHFYLHIDYPALDHVEVFLYSEGEERKSFITGDAYPFVERPVNYPSFLFPMELAPKTQARILIKVKTTGSVLVPASIWRKEAFLDNKQKVLLLYGMVTGIFLVMSFYNLFLFLSVRDKSYLYYGLFTLSYLGLTTSIEGYAYQWLWPEMPLIQQRSILAFGALSSLFLILFTKHFLPISANSRMRKWIRALTVVGALNLFTVIALPYAWAATMQSAVGSVAVLTAAIVSMVLSARSQSLARLFLAAWILFFVGVMSNILNNIGLIPYSAFSEYSSLLGAVIGLIMLSFALGYRIRLEMNEKQKAKQEALAHLTRYRSLYENSVEGIFLLDENFTVLQANPRFYALTHRSPSSSAPLDFTSLFSNPSRKQDFVDFLRSGTKVRNFEIYLKVSDLASKDPIWLSASVQPVTDESDAEARYEGSLIGISEVKLFEAKLRDLALHDSLTGLLRRRSFESVCREQLRNVAEHSYSGLLYVDIDQFRVINELCGLTAGDTLLKQVAETIQKISGSANSRLWCSRIAADEFGVLITDSTKNHLKEAAESIRRAIEALKFIWDDTPYQIECSIGLLIIEGKHTAVAELFNRAKKCCDTAKRAGRNRIYAEFEEEQTGHDERMHMTWINTIREASSKNYFQLQIQAIEDINERAIAPADSTRLPKHFEVLLRLNLPDDAGVSPDQFLPSAERFGLMPLVDRWVITNFFEWVNQHTEQFEDFDLASINLSMQSIGDQQFKVWLDQMFERYSVPPEKVCLEVTESVAMTNEGLTKDFLEHFKGLGCRFALDDFGTGFSSYAYLKSLGVDYVKIDGVFIHNIINNPVDYTMVKSICEIAQAMEIKTIAEFVENQDTLDCLDALGVDFIQGYFVHKPEPLATTKWN
jgi:diguanylate cyclase (GGDEF)-like protein